MISKRSRTLQSAKYLHKKRKKHLLAAGLISACILIFLGLVVLFLRLSFLKISVIEVSGTAALNPVLIRDTAASHLKGYYVHTIPRSNSLLYPRKNIEQALRDSYVLIETVRVSRKNLSGLEIAVTERVPAAIVCDGFRDEDEKGVCFFTDKDGYVYKESPGFSDGVYPRYYVSPDSGSLSLGSNFITPLKFRELQQFFEGLEGNGLSPLGILLSEAGSYELYVKNRDESAAVIYFDDRTPFDATLSNLAVFWDNAMNKKLGTTTVPAFNYINLRFGNNIFYSFK